MALSRKSKAYCPTGTALSARSSLRPGLARSCKVAKPAGLALGKITTRRFLTKVWASAWLTRFGGDGGSHVFGAGAGENICGYPLIQLLGQLLRAGKTKSNLYAGVLGFKQAPHGGERFGQGSCSQNGQGFSIGRGRRRRGRRLRWPAGRSTSIRIETWNAWVFLLLRIRWWLSLFAIWPVYFCVKAP